METGGWTEAIGYPDLTEKIVMCYGYIIISVIKYASETWKAEEG